LFKLIGSADVTRHGDCFASERLELFCRRFEILHLAAGNDDVCSSICEAMGNCFPNATASAGDKSDFALKADCNGH
jgi:hypothetical protein